MVPDSAPPAFIPRMGSLDDPAFGQDHESCVNFGCWRNRSRQVVQCSSRAVAWMPNNLNGNVMPLFDVACAPATVDTVGVKLFKSKYLAARLRDHRRFCVTDCHCRRVRMSYSKAQLFARPILHLFDDASAHLTRIRLIECMPRWKCRREQRHAQLERKR